MTNKYVRTLGVFCFCGILTMTSPAAAFAAQAGPGAGSASEAVQAVSSAAMVQVHEKNPNLYEKPEEGAKVLKTAVPGTTYEVLEMVDGGWIQISVEGTVGYINTEKSAEEMAQAAAKEAANASAARRQAIADYGLQFVGGRYVYGGTNPHTGVDCSGFTAYVLKHTAGVNLAHHAATQATQGRSISLAEARPGDLIFYSNGKRINHVALYIGNGQVVHASNAKYGIRTNNVNYRTPVKVVNVLGD